MQTILEKRFDLSVVIPFFNERGNLQSLIKDIVPALEKTGKSFEVIFVDDGSSDGGGRFIEEIAREDVRVKLIELRRNFGQTAALSAGFKNARGRVYIAMDADGQNDPADIPLLLAKLDEGFDCVSGWRKDRKDKFITRKIPSWTANRIISFITGCRLKDYGCSLKAYRAECIDEINLYGEMHRFIPAYAHMTGAKIAEIPVTHHGRTSGRSKYGLSRVFKVLIDLITVKFLSNYATKPGYLFGGMGFALCFLGILSAVEVLVEKYASGTFAHRNPFLLLAVFLFFLGVQFFLMGLMAELLVRTYHESQGKPIYLIKKTFNLERATSD